MPTIHLHIRRLVVDAPLRHEAAQWGAAIERALQAQETPGAQPGGATVDVPAAIAQQVARRIPVPVPAGRSKPARR
ncbi:MAG: hypothetical protein LBE78_01115 [Burkholderiaceae bacterium]|jgi:hypothetical protein|nr:hypothetical protein [Burkholderiaceae bacterium]